MIPISKIPFLFDEPEEVVCAVKMGLREEMSGGNIVDLEAQTVKIIAKALTGMK